MVIDGLLCLALRKKLSCLSLTSVYLIILCIFILNVSLDWKLKEETFKKLFFKKHCNVKVNDYFGINKDKDSRNSLSVCKGVQNGTGQAPSHLVTFGVRVTTWITINLPSFHFNKKCESLG